MLKFAPFITIYDFEASSEIQNEVIWTISSYLKGVASTRQRFNIHIVDQIEKERTFLKGSIKSVWKYYSIEGFNAVKKEAQKILLLDLITSCLLDVSEELSWNEQAILEAKEYALKQDLQFQYCTKMTSNKSGDTKARIQLELKQDKLLIWVEFFDKNNTLLSKKQLIETHPFQLAVFRRFEKPHWIDPERFGFQFKNGLTLSLSQQDEKGIWNNVQSELDEVFIKQLDVNDNRSFKELANW